MPHLTSAQWALATAAAIGIGIGKSGLLGVSLFHVLAFAFLFGARDSTGIVLPMLLIGDVGAVWAFRRHARWDFVRRMLPPACVGVVAAAAVMSRLDEAMFRRVIGTIILILAVTQTVRTVRPQWLGRIPHSRPVAWTTGLFAGMTTMLANAAGPVMAIYSLAIGLPKLELVGTNAWFFLLINAFKVPFSYKLGLISGHTLLLNLTLAPAIVVGLFIGRALTTRVSQRVFDGLLLAGAVIAALRLVGMF